MPYIVTTKRPDTRPSRRGYADDMRITSRRAVATLEEANQFATETVLNASMTPRQRAAHIIAAPFSVPSHGGTVGPLPDGTVIEVERVGWNDLRAALGHKPKAHEPRSPLYTAIILAAFNAREARQ